MNARAIATALALFISAPHIAISVRNDNWTVLGPGGGGALFHPTVSPHDSSTVFIGCDMTGAYLTRDGGRSWRMINLRGVPRFFVFDPNEPRTFYVQSMGLWRSRDAGATWELVHPDPRAVTGISMIDDHADPAFETKAPSGTITALAVDPADSRTLYAVFRDGARWVLRVSRDAGASWTAQDRALPEGANRVYIDPASSKGTRTAYVIGSDRADVLERNVWRSGARAPERFIDSTAGSSGDGKPVLYGISQNAVFVSRDGGASWTRSAPAGRLQAIATSEHNAATVYVSFGARAREGRREFGVAKSNDFGATWAYPWSESDTKSESVDNGWVSERFGTDWGGNPLSLGVAPKDAEIVWSGDFGRALRSGDGGKTWLARYTRRPTDRSGWATTGLDVTTAYGVHFDPFDPKHLFISYTDIGLWGSTDGGASWTSATRNGVPRAWVNTTYWVEFDPAARGRVWAAMSGTHDLPRPKMWRRTSPASYKGGVLRSDDGGSTWRALTGGLPQTAATHILLDPRSPKERRVLYVAGFGRGVFRSGDGGEHWELKNSGLPGSEPFAWRLAQDRDGTLYVVIARRSEDGSIANDQDGAIYRSRNGADSWERVSLPAGVNGPNGLAIDPDDPRRLYLAAWRRRTADADGGGGIYLSTDAGATWRKVLAQDQHVYDVTIDPHDGRRLFASGFESSAWRSPDRGETWSRIRGYNFKWGHRVIPDPHDSASVFITTFGGSVWHGPANGDPNAVEDIVTPGLTYSTRPKVSVTAVPVR